MQFSLSVSGTPAEVKQKVMTLTKEAGHKDQATWPALVSLRDYAATKFADTAEDANVTVSMSVAVTVSVSDAKKPKASKS